MTEINYLVCTHCFTYNQAEYIRDCLDGFCIQQTSFPVVYIVMDDASIDDEQDIICDYFNEHFELKLPWYRNEETSDYVMMFAQHKNNPNCFFAIYLLKYNHFGKKSKLPYIKGWDDGAKYIALCEGDDYWIAPDKLQKQVDYLEIHPDCTAVFSNIIIRDEKVSPIKEHPKTYLKKNIYSLKDVYRGLLFNINCICVRIDVINHLVDLASVKSNGDFKYSYLAAKYGYVYKFEDYFSVYRRTGKGMSSQWGAKEQFIHSIQEWTAFHRQLGYPDKTSLAIFQTKQINGYLFGTHFKNLPYTEIKDDLLSERWYVYIVYFVKYFSHSIMNVFRKRICKRDIF